MFVRSGSTLHLCLSVCQFFGQYFCVPIVFVNLKKSIRKQFFKNRNNVLYKNINIKQKFHCIDANDSGNAFARERVRT